jgi:hypothetical protein
LTNGVRVLSWGSGATDASISFATGAANAVITERMRIHTNGNVGIGTTTPNAQLQLSSILGNRKLVLFETVNNDHQFYGFGINNSTLRYQVDNPAGNHVFYAGNGATASNELMRIQGTGNVGIGTATPGAKLEVAGVPMTTAIETEEITRFTRPFVGGVRNTTSSGIRTGSFETGIVGRGRMDLMVSGAPVAGNSFGFVPDVNVMTLNGNGNVGIGTVNPFEKLDVRDGALQAKQTIVYSTAGTKDLLTLGLNKSSSNFGSITSYVWQAEKLADGGSIKLNLLSQAANGTYGGIYDNADVTRTNAMTFYNGTVGIGTSSPTANLHVIGTAKLGLTATNSGYIEFERTGQAFRDGYLGYGMTNNGGLDLVSEVAFKPLNLNTNSGNIILGPGSGNVGISTSTPTSTLDVNGSTATVVTNTAANFTLTAAHSTLTVDLTAAAATVTLPAASTCSGRLYNIVRTDGTNNVLTFSLPVSVGNTTFTTSNIPGAVFNIQSNGTSWRLVNN